MLKAIPTILLLLTIAATAKAAEPTLADAKAAFDAGNHSAALAKISRILKGTASPPGNAQRYDLFMLRGDCLLQKRSSPEAASLTVLIRSSNDRATRLIVTFGYLASNCLLSSWICAF